jgi:nicotinamide-nucleotide amidase
MFSEQQIALAEQVLNRCRLLGLKLAVAESCTGGLIGGCLTAVPGSSAVFSRGFITYDNVAKTEMLGVSKALLAQKGAVDEAVAGAMAEGALTRGSVQASIAATGIAGPTGGSRDKPVGLVHIAAARAGQTTSHRRCQFQGDRNAIRMATITAALQLLLERLADDQ